MSSEAGVEGNVIGQLLSNVYLQPEPQLEKQGKGYKADRVIVLAGPTGVGKTALSLELAKTVGGEVISADSMQVYQGMDIGTAKVTAEERAQIPHHMIDEHPITEEVNVVDFYMKAKQVIKSVVARNRVPIVVGGSGFYIHTLMYGPPPGPSSDPDVREKLEREMELMGPDHLYARVVEVDPDYAKTITPHDRQKIVRALEIMILSGQKVSSFEWNDRREPLDYDFHCWFLHRPREELYERVEARCDAMIEAGLLEEVERLDREGIRRNRSAAQAIGYRQAIEYFDSPQQEEDYNEFVTRFKTASRRYIKRQLTWFRNEPLFRWIDMTLHDEETVVDIIGQDYLRR